MEEIRLDLTGKYIYNIGFNTNPTCPPGLDGCGSGSADTINIYKICRENFGGTGYGKDCKMVDIPSTAPAIKTLERACAIGLSNPTDHPAKEGRVFGTPNFDQFRALACAHLGGSRLDVWSIDQRKDLLHRKDGTN